MKLKSLHVKNFRGIKDDELTFDDVTVLIGRNGVGKTSYLDALFLFCNEKNITKNDFTYNETTPNDLSMCIQITFENITDNDRKNFDINSNFIMNNKQMIMKKSFILKDDAVSKPEFLIQKKQNKDFDAFRNASGNNNKTEYNKLKNGDYPTLEKYTKVSDAEKSLDEYEDENKFDNIKYQFTDCDFNIKKLITLTYVEANNPAIVGNKTVEYSDLLNVDTLILDYWKNIHNERYDKLMKKITDGANEMFDQTKYGSNLQEDINKYLTELAPNYKLMINFTDSDQEIKPPKSNITINENNKQIPLSNVGQGLQRSFIISTIRTLNESYKQDHDNSASTIKIIMIDEPELFQHPNQQKHFWDVLRNFADHAQIIFSTHSPYFISLKHFNAIHQISKNPTCGVKNHTTSFSNILNEINNHEKKSKCITDLEFSDWLDINATINIVEGFFAKFVILVEGSRDCAPIKYMCDFISKKKNILHSKDMTIIPCGGKGKLNRLATIFQAFHIECYVIWDSDYKVMEKNIDEDKKREFERSRIRDIKSNEILLRCMNHSEMQDHPDLIEKTFACFKENMTSYILPFAEKCGHKNLQKHELARWDIINDIMMRDVNNLPKLKNIAKNILSLAD